MIIPGFIITWLTFPGVIIHELAHKIFCHLTNTKVLRVCYFRLGNPAGFVVHEPPSSTWKNILIGVGPLFLNTFAGFVLGLIALLVNRAVHNEIVFAVLMWLAVSVAMHSFPSTGDAKCIWAAVWRKDSPILAKLVGTPLVGFIVLGAIGSFFWLDLVYGMAVVAGLPHFLRLSV